MASITTRGSKGTPLTHNEVDANFSNLNSDKLDTAGIALGSAASPTIKFTSDTNTGIYSPGADQVAVSTGGTGRLFVNSSGQTGLGISTPGALLHLGHSTAADIRLSVNSILQGNIYSSVSDTNIFSVQANPLIFGTSNTERARIDSSGRLLVGTTTAANTGLLNVAGNISLHTGGTTAGRQATYALGVSDAGTVWQKAQIAFAGAGTNGFLTNIIFSNFNGDFFNATLQERARIDSSGRLLVGTSTSTNNIRLQQNAAFVSVGDSTYAGASLVGYSGATLGNASPILDLSRSRGTTDGSLTAVASGDRLGIIAFRGADGSAFRDAAYIEAYADAATGASDMPGRLVFSTTADGAASPTERMRIDNQGSVAIGRNSALARLHVGGETAQFPTSFRIEPTAHATSRRAAIGFGSDWLILQDTNGNGVLDFGLYNSASNRTFLGISTGGTTTLTSNASTAPFVATINASEVARIDGSGRLLIGTSSAPTFNASTAPLNVAHGDVHAASFIRYSANEFGSFFGIGKSRNATVGSHTAVINGDTLGIISFFGSNGTDFSNQAAQILGQVDAEPFTAGDTTDLPGRLVFSTTADTSSSPTERLRITQQGVIAYNQAAPATCNTSATITAADLTNGIITSSTAAAVTMTLPTGTDIEAAFSGLYNNFTFEFGVINTGPNTLTVAANGNTLVGSMTVATGTSARFAARRTAASTWTVYRLV